MGRGRVAEPVRADRWSALHAPDEIRDDGTDLPGIDAPSASPEEQSLLDGITQQQGPSLTQVLVQPLSCGNAVRHDAFAVALAAHPDEPAAVVDGRDVDTDQLADADTGGVEELDHGEITERHRPTLRPVVRLLSRDEVHPFGGDVEHALGVALGEHGGQWTERAGGCQAPPGIVWQPSRPVCPGSERAGPRGPARHGRPGVPGLEQFGEPGAQQDEIELLKAPDAVARGVTEQ
jgi:hypothetical protein